MSEIKALKNKTRRMKKGISPVIATVILVAVAVVIAAALAGFSSSLFGTYSSAGAAVVVKSIEVNTAGTAIVSLTNTGNVDDQLLSMSVAPFSPGTLNGLPASTIVPANGEALDIVFDGLSGGAPFTAGENITVRMVMKSGVQLTQSVIVTA